MDKEAAQRFNDMGGLRITRDAIDALQEVTEAFVITDFECSNLLAVHARCVTLKQEDMQLNDILRQIHHGDIGNASSKFLHASGGC